MLVYIVASETATLRAFLTSVVPPGSEQLPCYCSYWGMNPSFIYLHSDKSWGLNICLFSNVIGCYLGAHKRGSGWHFDLRFYWSQNTADCDQNWSRVWKDKPGESRCERQKQTNEQKGRAEVRGNAKSNNKNSNYSVVDHSSHSSSQPSFPPFIF